MAGSSHCYTHAFTLLKDLNSQRSTGQFCDCVIRLQPTAGWVSVAHRSVLAASSPVLASLLSSQGALLDLQFPGLTSEILDQLLEFIYTGELPPAGQESLVYRAAVSLQMEELQQALENRGSAPWEPSEKSNAAECYARQSQNPAQPHSGKDDPKVQESPQQDSKQSHRCEVVPVICRASTIGQENEHGMPYLCSPVIMGTTESRRPITTHTKHRVAAESGDETSRLEGQEKEADGQLPAEDPKLKRCHTDASEVHPEMSSNEASSSDAEDTFKVGPPCVPVTSTKGENLAGYGERSRRNEKVGSKRCVLHFHRCLQTTSCAGEVPDSAGSHLTAYQPAYQGNLTCRYLHGSKQSSDWDEEGLCLMVTNSQSERMPIMEFLEPTGSTKSDTSPRVTAPYQCTLCDRAFSQRGSLNRHLRSHLGVRPYSCPRCPMTFSRQYRVSEHLRVHLRGCQSLQQDAAPT